MLLKVSSAKWRPCCLGLNVLITSIYILIKSHYSPFLIYWQAIRKLNGICICVGYIYCAHYINVLFHTPFRWFQFFIMMDYETTGVLWYACFELIIHIKIAYLYLDFVMFGIWYSFNQSPLALVVFNVKITFSCRQSNVCTLTRWHKSAILM